MVATKHAVQLSPQTLNAGTALLVEEMGAEFNGNTLQLLKGMLQQQQLTFGIECRALHAPAVPGGANFHASVAIVNVHVSGQAHGFAGGILDHGEWQHGALVLQTEAPRDFCCHALRGRNRRVPQAPELAVQDGFDQVIVVLGNQRHQSRVLPGQCDRLAQKHV